MSECLDIGYNSHSAWTGMAVGEAEKLITGSIRYGHDGKAKAKFY